MRKRESEKFYCFSRKNFVVVRTKVVSVVFLVICIDKCLQISDENSATAASQHELTTVIFSE